MNARDDLERIIPRLRRYARAVTGDAAVADDCVARALARTAETPVEGGEGDALTLALFRALDHGLRGAPSPRPSGRAATADLETLEGGLRGLSDLERHVLLLNGLERFEPGDIARIVGLPEAQVCRWLETAYSTLQGARRGRVLVCRDPGEANDVLVCAVKEAGHDVVAEAPNDPAAIDRARDTRPDLIFADLDRAGRAPCVEAIEAVRALVDVGCVVVTAGADAALARLADTPVLVLSKPIDARLLAVAFAQALKLDGQAAAGG